MRASMEDIVPLADSRPLLEQLFIGDAANVSTVASWGYGSVVGYGSGSMEDIVPLSDSRALLEQLLNGRAANVITVACRR